MFRAEDLPVAATGSIRFFNGGVAEGDYVTIGDGQRSFTFEFDDGVYATGSITLGDVPSDGEIITISDGVKSVVFEFDDDASVTEGNVSVTIGASADATMVNLIDAINGETADLSLTAAASDPADNACTLTSDFTGPGSNVAITTDGVDVTVTGMSGGLRPGEGTVSAGNIIIAASIVHADVASDLADAINATTLDIRAEAKGGAVLLTHKTAGTDGNVTITKSGTYIAVSGMSGGLNLYTGIAGDTEFVATGGNTPRSSADRAGDDGLHIKEKGAVSDGTTDDTIAVQAAIDAVAAAGGGIVRLPPGTTLVSTLTIDAEKVTICGAGDGLLYGSGASILKQKAATTGDLITITANAMSGGLIGFAIDGNKDNQSAANNGIAFTGNVSSLESTWRIERVQANNCKNDGINQGLFRRGMRMFLNQVFNNGRYGLYLGGSDNLIMGNVIGNNTSKGIRIENWTQKIIGNDIFGSAQGIDIAAGGYKHIEIIGNNIDRHTSSSINIGTNSKGVNVIGNSFHQSVTSGGNHTIYVSGDYCNVSNNDFGPNGDGSKCAALYSIYVAAGKTGNTFFGNRELPNASNHGLLNNGGDFGHSHYLEGLVKFLSGITDASLAGVGTRALYVDENGRLTITGP